MDTKKAYYTYIDIQRVLKQMNEHSGSKYKNSTILKDFDIVLQCVLLYISFNNKTVDSYEMKFIDKITLESDILKILSEKLGRTISWNDLTKLSGSTKLQDFLDSMLHIFSKEINDFISFIGKSDGLTIKEYDKILYDDIKKICNYLAILDGDESDLECVDKAIRDVFFDRYLDLKNIIKN